MRAGASANPERHRLPTRHDHQDPDLSDVGEGVDRRDGLRTQRHQHPAVSQELSACAATAVGIAISAIEARRGGRSVGIVRLTTPRLQVPNISSRHDWSRGSVG